ncbi:MAG TPA: HAMP domain-containing sensor histidine kinase [Flavobacteriales bacterium]|nr:HAMP domain-containing sensor histidine kinase [Flavobacteriales bacterium]HNU55481.1 HAMP domain-containing sensor histidine kinase [Flavobacteriales bacterium]
MGRRAIATLMLLATLSVIGVVVIQLLWLQQASRYREEQVELNREQGVQLEKQFNDRVVMALTDVTERILSITKDPTDLFDAVKQVRPNYFAVSINDTVHPYLLEAMLRKEFSRRNIQEDFEYGIYDCFTDSIVYGNYVSVDSAVTDTVAHSQLQKLDKDGHYFGVYFPRRKSTLWEEEAGTWMWIFPFVVTLIVFSFFAYSVWVILRQRKLSEMKNDFIGNMTHELKTPISTIALSSEVLGDPDIVKEPDRLRQYARIIRSENERLRIQVERVLQLGSMDKDKLELKRERVDMHVIAREVEEHFHLQAQERNTTITLRLEATDHTVHGDRMHLTNAVTNLIDNALKYGREGGHIELMTSSRGRELLLSVSDDGIGIRKEDLRHIFERFYRVHTGNVHDVKGFGLGLHYVKQIVEAHGGGVSARSEFGKGSTFMLSLPISP